MVIREILELGREKLKNLKYADPLKESIYILSEVLNRDKSFIFTNLDRELSKKEEGMFLKYIGKRAAGEPVSYIFNKKEFMGIDLFVGKGVLIPRPETEELVEYLINYIDKNFKNKNIKILDIGVGSGAISLSIASKYRNINVLGTDISSKAIGIANKNLNRLGLENVEFRESDLFGNIKKDEKFSIIVSNPPYIETNIIDELQIDVKDYEPLLALDGGEDGLTFYRKIAADSKAYLLGKGMLVFEIGYNQGQDVKSILLKEGFTDVQVKKDLQGLDRIVLGFKG